MNTLWLKIAGIAVVVLIGIILVARLAGPDEASAPEPGPASKTVYDTWEEDDKRLNSPLASASPNQAQPGPSVSQPAVPALQPEGQAQPRPSRVFKPLEEEQQIRAEQLWQMVLAQRKMGRLPVLSYGQMVQYCRQILREFPGSEYAYRAKLALADIPDAARRQHNITEAELDVSEFAR
ncbi:MAG: hypothetical protein KBE04_15865 [Phycisphaerae bacterium]|nr:hypothetical protein [Phycisphaerae bacterium]